MISYYMAMHEDGKLPSGILLRNYTLFYQLILPVLCTIRDDVRWLPPQPLKVKSDLTLYFSAMLLGLGISAGA